MSLTALDWMMNRAEAKGLRFHTDVRAAYHDAADVNDKRYDSRAGLGIFYRWRPRDIQALCERCHVTPQVHRSVFERIARNTEGYAPGSLPTRCEVVSTTAKPDVRDQLAGILTCAFDGKPPLVQRTVRRQWFARAGYDLMVLTTIISAGLLLRKFFADSGAGRDTWSGLAAGVADNSLSSHWLNVIASTVWNHPWVILMAAASLILVVWTDNWLDTYYSSFWHRIRDKLRVAM